MRRVVFALSLLLAGMMTEAQYNPPYGGPPMWSRRSQDYRRPPVARYPIYRPRREPLPPYIECGVRRC